MLTWKLRITVLWIAIAICQSVVMILLMFEPGAIRDLMTGEWLKVNPHNAGVQVDFALRWVVPLAMAFLTLVLRDTVSRWTNGILAAVSVVGETRVVVELLGGTFGGGVTFIGLVGSLIPLLILWHAWKWPRPSEVTPRQREKTTLR